MSIPTALGMVAILPDEVCCSGILTSWEVCGYFNSSIDGALSLLQVGVYRPMGEVYQQIHVVNLFMVPSLLENYTCFTRNDSAKVRVKAGDRIFVAVVNRCLRSAGTTVCPLNPVISATASALFGPVYNVLSTSTVSQNSFQPSTAAVNLRACISTAGMCQ